MNISLDPALLEAIQALAAKLGTTVEYLFGVMTKQAIANATGGIILCSVGLVFAIVLVFVGVKCCTKWDPNWNTPFAGVCFILALILTVLGVSNLVENIKGLMNPDYYALKLLFQTLK